MAVAIPDSMTWQQAQRLLFRVRGERPFLHSGTSGTINVEQVYHAYDSPWIVYIGAERGVTLHDETDWDMFQRRYPHDSDVPVEWMYGYEDDEEDV